jgi:hypothetical protein
LQLRETCLIFLWRISINLLYFLVNFWAYLEPFWLILSLF